MNNYEYCATWVREQRAARSGRVLDYGCGAGQIVALLRDAGCDAYGCDVFYDGGDCSTAVPDHLFGSFIRRMQGDSIPFESASFDIVISNFVLEHVPDIERVLDEIHRVLKPGGMVLSLFPDRGVWREGHCGIPFLHWFSKGSRVRVYYCAFMSLVGFGDRRGRAPMTWAAETCEWLDKWTYYRTRREIRQAYDSRFHETQHIEDHWLRTRLGDRLRPARALPIGLQRFFVRKLGALALVSRKT